VHLNVERNVENRREYVDMGGGVLNWRTGWWDHQNNNKNDANGNPHHSNGNGNGNGNETISKATVAMFASWGSGRLV
jgi:hypothetical protein